MRSKIGYGVLGVTVAFLLATNPVVVNAAGQITSQQIKNETIKSKDIKNDKVKGVDINESTLGVVPNATQLNGQPASAYQNVSYRYRLPAGSPATTKTFSFPGLPAGSYLVTYATAIVGSAVIACSLSPDNTNFLSGIEAVSFSASSSTSFTNHGSTVVTVASGKTAGLRCSSGATFSVYGGGDAQSSMTFTRLDSIVDQGTSTVARQAGVANKGFAG